MSVGCLAALGLGGGKVEVRATDSNHCNRRREASDGKMCGVD